MKVLFIAHSNGTFLQCCCSVTKSCPTLCDHMDCSTPSFSVLHYLLEYAQTHVHWVSDAIQLSHPRSFPSPPTLKLSQKQGLFQWVSSSYQAAKVELWNPMKYLSWNRCPHVMINYLSRSGLEVALLPKKRPLSTGTLCKLISKDLSNYEITKQLSLFNITHKLKY